MSVTWDNEWVLAADHRLQASEGSLEAAVLRIETGEDGFHNIRPRLPSVGLSSPSSRAVFFKFERRVWGAIEIGTSTTQTWERLKRRVFLLRGAVICIQKGSWTSAGR